PCLVRENNLETYLGLPTFAPFRHTERAEIGMAQMLAWGSTGGEVLWLEVSKMKGSGHLLLTGQIGEVMKESAQTIRSYLRSHPECWEGEDMDWKQWDIHFHAPLGGVTKDGPSAGLALFAALFSLLRAQPLPVGVAMTGEVTLRGKILGVGGLREKLLAAQRAHLHTLILPKQNQAEVECLPKSLHDSMQLVFLNQLQELMDWLEP
ncbi:MAG: S16 family serine protease, partial [Myxococcota bacterium]